MSCWTLVSSTIMRLFFHRRRSAVGSGSGWSTICLQPDAHCLQPSGNFIFLALGEKVSDRAITLALLEIFLERFGRVGRRIRELLQEMRGPVESLSKSDQRGFRSVLDHQVFKTLFPVHEQFVNLG